MSLDTLYLIKYQGKEVYLEASNSAFDACYAVTALELIEAMQSGALNSELFEGSKVSCHIVSKESYKGFEPNVTIDLDKGIVWLPLITFYRAEDFCNEYDVKIVYQDGKAYIDWDDGELEPLIDAKAEIDAIYPYLKKGELTIEELKEYADFIRWCGNQQSTTFEYCDSLIYHYEPA